MKLEKIHIENIKLEFAKMETREDLLSLLNYTKSFIYGDDAIPFQLKQLTYYSNPKKSKNSYTEFKIKKKSGSERSIHAPKSGLKAIQKTLSLIFQCVFEPHNAAMAYTKNKSIVDNAKIHQGNNYVYNIDLKDFFSSIDQARVWSCLRLRPFNLIDENSGEAILADVSSGIRIVVTDHNEEIFYQVKEGTLILFIDKNGNYFRYRNRISNQIPAQNLNSFKKIGEFNKKVSENLFEDIKKYIKTEENIELLLNLVPSRNKLANMLAGLCCTEINVERKDEKGYWQLINRNVLPQGAPTSPVLSNVVCQRLDFLLSAVAKRFDLNYSRYADDITFSSMHNVYHDKSDFLNEMQRIIKDQGFDINERKTRLQKSGYRKEVTGLVVNEKANVKQRYVKQLRMWLYYWERYGYNKASEFFSNQYLYDKGHVIKGKPNMDRVIGGKLDYLKMVKGDQNRTYLSLKNRFDKLTTSPGYFDKILRVWDTNGIEEAMDIYYFENHD